MTAKARSGAIWTGPLFQNRKTEGEKIRPRREKILAGRGDVKKKSTNKDGWTREKSARPYLSATDAEADIEAMRAARKPGATRAMIQRIQYPAAPAPCRRVRSTT